MAEHSQQSEPETLRSILEQEKQDFARPASRKSRLGLAVRALRHRNFQLFFGGQLISLVGTWMQTVAQSWLVYRLTGSALLLGSGRIRQPDSGLPLRSDWRHRGRPLSTGIASSSPPRRSPWCWPSILALLTLTRSRAGLANHGCSRRGLGVVNAFDIPARQAFLIEMVGREDLLNAIALNSSMFNGARIIGPAIAGILVAAIGEGWCFCRQRGQLYRGDRGPAADDASRIRQELAARSARRWRTSSRDSRSCEEPARSARFCCCWAWSAWWECPTPC